MAEGSNYKKQVMEALSICPTNLITNKAFLWAATNLPGEGGIGKFKKFTSSKVDHDATDVYDAFGLNSDKIREIVERGVAIFKKSIEVCSENGEKIKKSIVLEQVLNSEDEELILFFTISGFLNKGQQFADKAMEQSIEESSEDIGDIEEIKDKMKTLSDLSDMLKVFAEYLRKHKGDK